MNKLNREEQALIKTCPKCGMPHTVILVANFNNEHYCQRCSAEITKARIDKKYKKNPHIRLS